MLDTIALSLNQNEFRITDMEKFSPSAQGLYAPPYYKLGARGNISCYQNPTKTDLRQGMYKPRLTLTKRKSSTGYVITLRCEFSAPKLMHGNNFDELCDADFEYVLDSLHGKLASMGVMVEKDTLRKAQVSAIHYSKNLPLTDHSNCAMVLNELRKINVNQRLDLSHTDYRNEGHAVRYHSNSFELAFYDKIKDMKQAAISERRALESDCAIQANLFTAYVKPLEVLRMEVRLGNRTKLKGLLSKLGINSPMEFNGLFKTAISKTILLHFWHSITQDMPLLVLSRFKPEDMYYALAAETKGRVKPAKILQQVGALMIAGSVGMRGLHSLTSKHSTTRTWQRIKKELEGLDITARMKYAAMENVQRCLEGFKPLRISDYMTLKI